MQWSYQQSEAIEAVGRWLKRKDKQVFRLFGYAGTGKSTLAKSLAESVRGRVVYAAFTGKAALVMRRKGCDEASTLHSLIYTHKTDDHGLVEYILNPASMAATAALIIIDEVSMVGDQLGCDLLSFNRPVLVLGDPAQLPPVEKGKEAGGFFTRDEPDVMLTEIHRQAENNPIIAMATAVREGREIEIGGYGDCRVITRKEISRDDILSAGQVLVGLNRTRVGFNARIRQLRGFKSDLPEAGDKLVCLKNNHPKGLLNGGLWKVHSVLEQTMDELRMLVDSEDFDGTERKEVLVPKKFFIGGEKELDWRYLRTVDQMTYGYALTVHKSQGSQWDDVVVFDESQSFREDARRHLYTAITRAAEKVTIVK
ncbi:MAG: AAA family ATPase [Phycisphaerae bacterium]|nr:AAA family ATPase [Phycisphaerae bacterium]